MPKLIYSGVYAVINSVNGKRYVGSASVCIKRRLADHLKRLRGGYHKNPYLQAAWCKYGESAFKFKILELCSSKKCVEREQYWIDFTQSHVYEFGYNRSPTAGNTLGFRLTPNQLAQKRALFSTETHRDKVKLGVREAWKRQEHRDKMAEVCRSGSFRDAVSKAAKKAWQNPSTRARHSVAQTRSMADPNVRRKIAESNRGKKRSLETRARIALAKRNMSEETRARMSASAKRRHTRRKLLCQ